MYLLVLCIIILRVSRKNLFGDETYVLKSKRTRLQYSCKYGNFFRTTKNQLEQSLSQFPHHMDFQKVGDTIFNNEIYSILKPATHVVSDYFTDYILRRENTNFPTKRLFLDDNGFRHFWSGVDQKTKSLRKTEVLSDVIETVENVTDIAKNITDNVNNDKTHNGTKNANSNEDSTSMSDKNNSSKNDNDKHNTKTNEGVLNKTNVSKNKKRHRSAVKTTTPKGDDFKVIRKSKTPKSKKTQHSEIHLRGGATTKPVKERTFATTTFFCPFFGVITMSAFID